jgi:hypothetical protein
MTSELLLVCPQCGRRQQMRESCSKCGAHLSPISGQDPTGRDSVLQAYQPFLEGDLGLERRILLSAKRLEWRPRRGEPVIAEVQQIEWVRLLSRPVWESLFIGAVASIVLAFASAWAIRALLAGIVLLAVAACFLQKRYALLLKMRDGRLRSFELGIGARRAPVVQRIESVWDSLQPALEELGIRT